MDAQVHVAAELCVGAVKFDALVRMGGTVKLRTAARVVGGDWVRVFDVDRKGKVFRIEVLEVRAVRVDRLAAGIASHVTLHPAQWRTVDGAELAPVPIRRGGDE